MIESGEVTNYELFEDIGIEIECEPSHHRLTEEQEDGSKKITHWQGDKKWVTFEGVKDDK